MKKLFSLLALSAAVLSAPHASASVINFDDLNAGGKLASMSGHTLYDGLSWSSSWYLGDTSVSGYANGAHSGSEFLLNGFGVNNLGISSATPFTFLGAWFATPNTNGAKANWINVSAYDSNNVLVGSTGQVAVTGIYTQVATQFANVSRLTVSRDQGWFVMDDLSILRAAEAPEPASIALVGFGLGLLGLARRRRQVR